MKTITLETHSAAACETDLCITCMHYPDCSFRNLSTTSIFFCEEFQLAYDGNESVKNGKDRSVHDRMDPATEEAEKLALKGLCCNCANRWSCAYPKPLGGVWHCGEYA